MRGARCKRPIGLNLHQPSPFSFCDFPKPRRNKIVSATRIPHPAIDVRQTSSQIPAPQSNSIEETPETRRLARPLGALLKQYPAQGTYHTAPIFWQENNTNKIANIRQAATCKRCAPPGVTAWNNGRVASIVGEAEILVPYLSCGGWCVSRPHLFVSRPHLLCALAACWRGYCGCNAASARWLDMCFMCGGRVFCWCRFSAVCSYYVLSMFCEWGWFL